WDTYDKGNYDVRLHVIGKDSKTLTAADSPRFEARPSLACDAKDRVWIAYESGDEQWGKDYSTTQIKKTPFDKNPGCDLYVNRTIGVKCLVDGKLMQPANAFRADQQRRNQSVPRLVVDNAGGVWLLYRQHPLPGGQGEVWNSYAVRYDGQQWSTAQR